MSFISKHYEKIRKAAVKKLTSFESQKDIPSTVGLSVELARNQFENVFPYEYVDEDNVFYMDENNQIVAGFGFILANPALRQGDAILKNFNSLFGKLPEGAVFTSAIHSSPVVGYFLDEWEGGKNIRGSLTSSKMVKKRKDFLEKASGEIKLYPNGTMYSRNVTHYVFIRLPFTGDLSSDEDVQEFATRLVDLKSTVKGSLIGSKLAPVELTESLFHFLMWTLLNPQKLASDQRAYAKEFIGKKNPGVKKLVHKNTRVGVSSKSSLVFSDGDVDKYPETVEVVPMTVDEYPDELYPQNAGSLIGDLVIKDDRISSPFFLYTNVEIVNSEKARKNVGFKKFLIQKQLVSESDFAKNNFAEMFRRRDDAEVFLKNTKGKNRPVRMMTGLNLYTTPGMRNIDIENVENIFKMQDYSISIDPFIGVPVFLSSLPFMYDPKVDLPNSGIQRSQMVTSYNSACAMHLSGEWKGTNPSYEKEENAPALGGGLMFQGPKGQLASIDVYQSVTNYNGICIGTSGAGKSYVLAELASDIYCRDGVVRIVDSGRSYYNLCEFMGGQNVVFDTANPISLNPFWGVSEEGEFRKLEEFWRDLLVSMAYPEGRDSDSWEFRFIQTAVGEAWRTHRDELDLAKIVETMGDIVGRGVHSNLTIAWTDEKGEEHQKAGDFDAKPNDSRGYDVIYQLSPYSTPEGTYFKWFSGPCQLELNNDFMVFELDELSSSQELKAIVLMLVTNQIERELYLSDRTRWRLTVIDEAYDLIRDPRVGRVIEYLFRKARKYRGSCWVGTQGYQDLYYNEATKGIVANAGWKWTLQQEGTSAKKAFEENILPDNEDFHNLVANIAPGNGYGEILVKTPSDDVFLYRFVTDPYSYFMYSSKDMKTVNKLAEEKMRAGLATSMHDATALAIEEMSDDILEKRFYGKKG